MFSFTSFDNFDFKFKFHYLLNAQDVFFFNYLFHILMYRAIMSAVKKNSFKIFNRKLFEQLFKGSEQKF